jgi:hypothetical protein
MTKIPPAKRKTSIGKLRRIAKKLHIPFRVKKR